MMYAPHLLYVRRDPKPVKDSLGRSIRPAGDPVWELMGACRCDDSGKTEVRSDNGELFRPSYHIVCEGDVSVEAGDVVRVMWADGLRRRAEGVVRNVTGCNFLSYKSVYL